MPSYDVLYRNHSKIMYKVNLGVGCCTRLVSPSTATNLFQVCEIFHILHILMKKGSSWRQMVASFVCLTDCCHIKCVECVVKQH